MKNGLKFLTLTAAVLLTAYHVNAQPPVNGQPPVAPPPPPAAPAPQPGLAPSLPGAPGPQAVQALTNISGRIVEYSVNDRYEYDGFALRTADKTVAVKFPAHLGSQLMKAAAKGSQVYVSGTYDETPEGTAFRLYSLKAGGNTITDTAPPVDQTPPVEQIRNFAGTISDLNHDQRGMINGVVLNSKTFVSLPPPAVKQLAGYLKVGTSLSGTGIQRPVPSGVVVAKSYDLTDARTLSIAGQTYLIH
ncbi:hypothetical protein [Mucilaginibacter sp. KACC 22063]|uniref:hypothetical protein n=1 Tax=Mucilaginibacter sp. KACC 22063 TaxID=3025666 RepID=UPI0023667FC5|nr:hypothetical protein [Mucilaginibacter sp. KACC 22063]WDF56133.1 hypothetical protein PQ461_03545 [Mucilaginibacter sp. KACC 22063]